MKINMQKIKKQERPSSSIRDNQQKILKLAPFNLARYRDIGLDHLVMYAVGKIEKLGADLSFENITVGCFKVFPLKFSLPGFPNYPDSDRVQNCLNRCTLKTRQWLGGKTRQGFVITERSRVFIKEAKDLLLGRLEKETRSPSQTRRKEIILAEVENSPAYIKYKNRDTDTISEADFCFLLQGTLDSSREILIGNLTALKMFAAELQRDDVLKFVDWLEQRFKNFLDDKGK